MKASFLIINYRSLECLDRLVTSIEKYHTSLDYEIIIVNNNDDINILRKICSNKKNLFIIEPPFNLYFAPAINIAAKRAKGEYLVLINVDAYFQDSSVYPLIEFLDNNDEYAAAVGAIRNNDQQKNLTITTNNLPTPVTEIFRHTFIAPLLKKMTMLPGWYRQYIYEGWDRSTARDVGAGCDAFMVIRSIFFQQKSYTRKMLMYLTEEDIGRKTFEKGLRIRYIPDASVIHEWSYSTKKLGKPKTWALLLWDRFQYFNAYNGRLTGTVVCVFTFIFNPFILIQSFSVLRAFNSIRKEAVLIDNYVTETNNSSHPSA